VLTVALAVVSAVAWTLPSMRPWPAGPTDLEVELATERARSEDLKQQLEEASQQLAEPRPPVPDVEALARADDLARQLADAEEALARPRPPERDVEALARADDLSRQLADADEALARPRPPEPDVEALARADDLSAQVQELSEALSRPRPIIEPPVVATMNRDQILARRGLLGIYTAQVPFNFAEVNGVHAAVQRRSDIVGYFASWSDPFRADAVQESWKRGYVPLVTWESRTTTGLGGEAHDPDYSLPVILSGRHDDYIRSWARGVRELGLPLIIRLNHEMNAAWYPWSEVYGATGEPVNGNRRGDYARTWRHVHRIFAEEGANEQVIWLWSPNRVNRIPRQPPPIEFYPGDEYVDWIGMSAYHRFYDKEATFDETFGVTLPLLREVTAKPILLAEIGATEIGGRKVEWTRDLFRGLQRNPDIIGFVWFNFTVTAPVEGVLATNDWRMDSTPAATRAVREELAGAGWGQPYEPP
jgi:mannan endo-1,4-beta-mannosidase